MEEQNVQKKGAKRSFVGIVTSDKMDKTIVVSIDKKRWTAFTRNMLHGPRNARPTMKRMKLILETQFAS